MRVSGFLFYVVFALIALLSLHTGASDSEDGTIQDVPVDNEKNVTATPIDAKEDTVSKVDSNITSGKTLSTDGEEEKREAPPGPDSEEANSSDDEEDELIELNPDFEEPEDDSEEDDYDEYDFDEEEEADEEMERRPRKSKSAKSAIRKALDQGRKLPRNYVKIVKKNRLKITLALALIAFRREIGRALLNKIAPATGTDPKTGKTNRKVKFLILKVMVFLDIMRQIQTSYKSQSPVLIPLLILCAKNPMFGAFISRMILQEIHIYIPAVEQHYTFEKLNDRYSKDCLALEKAAGIIKVPQEISFSNFTFPHDFHEQQPHRETVVVLDLTKIESGWRMEMLRDQVSFLIHQHRQSTSMPYSTFSTSNHNKTHSIEVLVLLESPGGSAADFALASQHILRLRKEPGIQVTCCVDKVAASGGYMIACASSPGRLFAAPFAIVGSIGVIGQIVNVHKTLEGWGMKPMVFRSGKDKSPVNLIGDVTSKDMKRIQLMVDETHVAFKQHVARARPCLANTIDRLATGKVWLGYDALGVGLVDRIVTSDEYIAERIGDGATLLKLMRKPKKQFSMFGGPQRYKNEPLTSIGSSLFAPIKDYAQSLLISLAKNSNLEIDGDESSLSLRAPPGEVLARADTAYSFSTC